VDLLARQECDIIPNMSAADSETEQQQPALRVQDALGYLDQVKSKFNDQPFVYNQFLDIMKEFKSQSLDTPGVIAKVSTLFRGHTDLIVGFNTFLPPGYRIEQMPHNNEIRITTLQGLQQTPATFTLAQHQQQHQHQIQQQQLQMQQQQQQQLQQQQQPQAPQPTLVNQTNSTTVSPHESNTQVVTTTPLQHNNETRVTALIATTATTQQDSSTPTNLILAPQQQQPKSNVSTAEKIYHQTPFNAVQPVRPQIVQTTNYSMAKPVPHQQTPTVTNSAPSIQNSVSSATVLVQGSMIVGPAPTPVVNQNEAPKQHTQQPPSAMQPGSEFGFNHALNYVNKIKHRFSANPEIYQQFLEILHTYQRDQHATKVPRSKMLLEGEVYNQVARLFQNQRDLLEEFSQFLPDANGTGPVGSNINSLTRVHHQLSPNANINSSNPPNIGLRHVNDGPVVMNDEMTPVKRQNSRGANHQNKISMKRQNNSVGNLTYNSTKVSTILIPNAHRKRILSHSTDLNYIKQRPRMTSLKDVSLAEAGKHGSLNEYAFFDKVNIQSIKRIIQYYNLYSPS